MHRFFRRTTLFFLTAAGLHPAIGLAHTTPETALQAQEMLGRDIWAQVVELENGNDKSRYPSTLYATVFEFDDVLWFYTSTGTQPIERSRGRVDDYRKNLLPLLRTIERGFSSVTIVPPSERTSEDFPQLENGCVIESIFTLDQLRKDGERVQTAKLLLYSTNGGPRRGVNGSPRGHAVLVFETPEGRFFVDPPEIRTVKPLGSDSDWNPGEFAAAIEAPYGNSQIGEAFFVPVEQPGSGESATQIYSGDR